MTIICQSCSTRLQIDDDKAPTGAFTVRCPKCKSTVNASVGNPALDQSALGVGGSPSTEHPRYDQPTAPVYQMSNVDSSVEDIPSEDALRALLNLLSKGGSNTLTNPSGRPACLRMEFGICQSS